MKWADSIRERFAIEARAFIEWANSIGTRSRTRARTLIESCGRWLPTAHLVVGFLTLVVAVVALYFACSAYDIALQQVKDLGSWLAVTVAEFDYVLPSDEDKSCGPVRFKARVDTAGCFFIEFANRLPAQVIITSIDYRVPPQDWMSDWRLKEGIPEPKRGLLLSGFQKAEAILFASVAANPSDYYCRANQKLQLVVKIGWQDAEKRHYEMAKEFEAYCLKSKDGRILFRWTSPTRR